MHQDATQQDSRQDDPVGPDFACPICHGELVYGAGAADIHGHIEATASCAACDRRFPRVDGIWRFLVDGEQHRSFLESYRETRRAEGWGSLDGDYLRALPDVPADDPHAWIWRIRSRSFRVLMNHLKTSPVSRAVELGAGNGWLSCRLNGAGVPMTAVDLSDDPRDGLGAHRAYGTPAPFVPVQAAFDELPAPSGAWDAVIFNGSFHYAQDAGATLGEALRVLAPGGWIAVVDTPFYAAERDGQAMLDEARDKDPRRGPSVGFLCPSRLAEVGEELGLVWQVEKVSMGWRWQVKNRWRGLRRRRLLASFPLLIGRRRP